MIVKMTNQDKEFYQYMGKFFGSRLIEKQLNDRIYDDDNKEWYMYIEENKVVAFVSLNKNVIKNIYCTKNIYLEKLLKKILQENEITYSTVTKNYIDVYEKCGLKIGEGSSYKNFVIVYMETKETIA